MLNLFIKMFIDFSKQKGDLGINSGLTTLENSFGKLSENILFVRRVYDAGVCHGPVPVVKINLFQDRYIPPDRFRFWFSIFLALLHHNIHFYLCHFPS